MTDATKPEQTAVNDSGTGSGADARLTRGRSGPVRYQIIRRDGSAYPATFEGVVAAANCARALYPDQEQDPDRTGKGWDIQVCL